MLLYGCYLSLLLILASHTSLEECHASLYYSCLLCFFRLFLSLRKYVTYGFLLEIKTETRGCLVLNIDRFIVDDSIARYAKETNNGVS